MNTTCRGPDRGRFPPWDKQVDSENRFKEKLRWAGIGLGLRALARLLNSLSRRDPMLGRALREYQGVYRFESKTGVHARHLVFAGGRVFVRKKRPPEVHFTFTLHQPEALSFRSRPDQLLEIVIGNKIGQRGNTHYLYQLGFVLSLVENYFVRRRPARPTAAVSNPTGPPQCKKIASSTET